MKRFFLLMTLTFVLQGWGFTQKNTSSTYSLVENSSAMTNASTHLRFPRLNRFHCAVNTLAPEKNEPKRTSSVFTEKKTPQIFLASTFSISPKVPTTPNTITTNFTIIDYWVSNPRGRVVDLQSSLNPKIGFAFGQLWVKTGPSFQVASQNMGGDLIGDVLKLSETQINIAFNYHISW